MKEQEEIAAALKLLGVSGKIHFEKGLNVAIVYVDGKWFGIYDFIRKTFVD